MEITGRPFYVGDGVYCLPQPHGIWLYANDHLHPSDKVFLEWEVLEKINTFKEALFKANGESKES